MPKFCLKTFHSLKTLCSYDIFSNFNEKPPAVIPIFCHKRQRAIADVQYSNISSGNIGILEHEKSPAVIPIIGPKSPFCQNNSTYYGPKRSIGLKSERGWGAISVESTLYGRLIMKVDGDKIGWSPHGKI